MANKCSDYGVKGCPASYYLKCRAYEDGKNCWEVPDVPCCSKRTLADCGDCDVFRNARLQPNQQEIQSPTGPANLKIVGVESDLDDKQA